MAKSSRRLSRRGGVGPFTAPEDAARAADLRHVSDDRPGITRQRSGRGFSYANPDGTALCDRPTLARIRALAIPPAWTDVWICPIAHGHIQATGRDARHRKQYRYHPRGQQIRDATKYGRMVEFGTALPKVRARLQADLALPGIPKDKVLATVVRLLETTFIRVGNEEYARNNRSFGLTTLQDRHVEIEGSQIQFRFRGKSGKLHAVKLTDRRLAHAVQRIRELPGQDVFQFLDEAGQPQSIDSADVNGYLRTVWARISRPRTSARGPAPCSRHWNWNHLAVSTTMSHPRPRRSRPLRRWLQTWGTRRPCAARVTSIRRFLRPTRIVRCSMRGWRSVRTMNAPKD